jgi:hypothetical protein
MYWAGWKPSILTHIGGEIDALRYKNLAHYDKPGRKSDVQ